MPTKYGYGDAKVRGKTCPVITAGRKLKGDALELAEAYDSVARMETGKREGTLSKSEAEEFWEAAVSRFEDDLAEQKKRLADAPKTHDTLHIEEMIQSLERTVDVGREIQQEAFN